MTMTHESLRDSTLVSALKDLVADLSDLMRKELRLARAELAEKISLGMQAGIWMAVAAILMVLAGLLVIQSIVFGIASFGVPLHWSALIVAAVCVVIAAGSFLYGRSVARTSFGPSRTLSQIDKDIRAIRSNT
jgi:uncharacterized membrane protein YqjE